MKPCKYPVPSFEVLDAAVLSDATVNADKDTNADVASDWESPSADNIAVFAWSLVWTLCLCFQLSRCLATWVPSIKEFTRGRPVVGVIGCRICDSLRITALRQGSMWAIGDGVPCSNSGTRFPRLCRLFMVSALMKALSASSSFDFAAAMIRCTDSFGSRSLPCAWRASLYCFAAFAIARRIHFFRSRLCACVLPFGRPKMADGAAAASWSLSSATTSIRSPAAAGESPKVKAALTMLSYPESRLNVESVEVQLLFCCDAAPDAGTSAARSSVLILSSSRFLVMRSFPRYSRIKSTVSQVYVGLISSRTTSVRAPWWSRVPPRFAIPISSLLAMVWRARSS